MKYVIAQVKAELIRHRAEQSLASINNFFKEEVKSYGVKTPIVRQIGKELFKQVKGFSKADIFEICELLWQSGYIEEAFIACYWSNAVAKQYTPDDFAVFEKWVKHYVSNWATCDTFCNHTVGDFMMMYPDHLSKLKQFAGSPNRWERRAAAVSLIVPARKGLFLNDIFEIADLLLLDKDDLVQKGYGWMLKAASEAHQTEVFEYVMKHKASMPRTALRYAIEKMPNDLKEKAMSR
jgi:3-methyladenine DNA glycosylase AlkD